MINNQTSNYLDKAITNKVFAKFTILVFCLAFCFELSIILLKISFPNSFLYHLSAAVIILFWISLCIAKFNSNRNNKELTVKKYLKSIEMIGKELKQYGKHTLYYISPFKRFIAGSIILIILLKYLTVPVQHLLMSSFDLNTIYDLTSISRGLIILLLTVVILLTTQLIICSNHKYFHLKIVAKNANELINTLNKLAITVPFKHQNGIRIIDADTLMDHLIECKNDDSIRIYSQVKRMYKDLPHVEILPHEYNKSYFD